MRLSLYDEKKTFDGKKLKSSVFVLALCGKLPFQKLGVDIFLIKLTWLTVGLNEQVIRFFFFKCDYQILMFDVENTL